MGDTIKEELKQAIETYNKYAKAYIEHTRDKLLQYELIEFTDRLPKDAKILDVGCGSGRDIAYLKEDGFDVIGIDTAEGLLKEAEKENLPVKKMDMRNLEFEKETFDGIWCMASLADIPKEENMKVIQEFYKVLRFSGILFIATKKGEGEKIEHKKQYENAPRFYAYYTKAELEELLRNNNFTILKSTETKDGKNEWIEIFAEKN